MTMNRTSLLAMCAATFALAIVGSISPTLAGKEFAPQHYTRSGSFEDVFADLKDAVINRGLVIDYVGHVDKMLERTSAAAGSVTASGSKSPYLNAKYVQFCSAKLTHSSVSANPFNLSICPYVIFIFEAKTDPGKIVVGYRRPIPPGPSRLTKKAFTAIDKLLDGITKEAASE